MTSNKSPFRPSRGVRSLKSSVTQMKAKLARLHGVMGGQLRSHDAQINKISGGKPVTQPVSRLLSDASSPLDEFFSGLAGSAGAMISNSLKPSSKADSGDGLLRLSEGQIWAQAASAVSKAMRRNL